MKGEPGTVWVRDGAESQGLSRGGCCGFFDMLWGPAKYLSHHRSQSPILRGGFCFVGGLRGLYFVKKTDYLPVAD